MRLLLRDHLMYKNIAIVTLITAWMILAPNLGVASSTIYNRIGGKIPIINKCCPIHTQYVDGKCTPVNESNKSWQDSFWGLSHVQGRNYSHSGEPNNQGLWKVKIFQPNCEGNRIEKIVHNQSPPEGTIEPDVVLSIGDPTQLIWSDENDFINIVGNDEFCIDRFNDTSFTVVLCKPKCDQYNPCIRKCCNHYSVLSNSTCTASTAPWTPHLGHSTSSAGNPVSQDVKFHYKIGVPKCLEMYLIPKADEHGTRWYLLPDGSLMVQDGLQETTHNWNSFCVDGYSDKLLELGDIENPIHVVNYSGLERDQIAVICGHHDIDYEEPEVWRVITLATAALISVIFLSFTAIVYVILWQHQKIHGWLQFSYVVSLLLAFTLLATVQLFSKAFEEKSSICELLGSAVHFAFLSAFFWLTSLNFDVWWTFSGWHPLQISSKGDEKKRFLGFALFSVGLPCLISSIGIILDHLFKDHPETKVIIPRFGTINCYFYGDKEKFSYFYGPVGFLLLINSALFISTIHSINKLQNDTKIATRQSSKQEKKQFLLFMKLFVVMGVLWIFEVISWIFTLILPEHESLVNHLFVVTDVLNGLQGLAIFVIFVCKKKTFQQLKNRFQRLLCNLETMRDSADAHSSYKCKYILMQTLVATGNGINRLLQFQARPLPPQVSHQAGSSCSTTI